MQKSVKNNFSIKKVKVRKMKKYINKVYLLNSELRHHYPLIWNKPQSGNREHENLSIIAHKEIEIIGEALSQYTMKTTFIYYENNNIYFC